MNRRLLLTATVLLVGLGFLMMMGGLLYDVAATGPGSTPPAGGGSAAGRLATNLFLIGGGLASLGALAAVALAFFTVKGLISQAEENSGKENLIEQEEASRKED